MIWGMFSALLVLYLYWASKKEWEDWALTNGPTKKNRTLVW